MRKARRGLRPSYTWSSILSAKWVLDQGCIWRVGSGDSIGIWEDQWVPQAVGFRLYYGQRHSNHVSRVSQLLSPSGKSWNPALIRDIFVPHEAALILQIPLAGASSSEGAVSAGTWTALWKENSIPRCKEFAWRACHDVLLVRAVLAHCGVELDPICPLCGEVEKTGCHALFLCREVAPIWFGSHLSMDFRQAPHGFTVLNWLHQIFNEKDDWVVDSVLTLMLAIWERRNKWCFEKRWLPYMVIQRALSLAMVELSSSSQSGGAGVRARNIAGSATRGWKAPIAGRIKINVDVVVPAGSDMGFGYIARNSHGQVLATAAAKWP
ncbi:uncharacterized protein LOC130719554 [Lotus japonicus]|uniref:uncharacterized protein LOC130719554 n=1 Tax=Lotus japonicus TaxID=34305 RepID=UPI00258E86C5|nr:uncharacterized protein LOC130719554 [Lotus japonicus]